MADIVCATRGGEGSRAVQIAAIKRARETGKSLTFIYVISPHSIRNVDESIIDEVRRELYWMGETLLRIAQKRAITSQIHADIVIRDGNVQEEICRYISESDTSLLLLGAPRLQLVNYFGESGFEEFARNVCENTGIPVEIIRPDPKTDDD